MVALTADQERPLARSTLSDKLNAKSLPEWEFVVAFVAACVANADEAGIVLPAELTDLGAWDAAHWNLLRALDQTRADQRLSGAVRAELSRPVVPRQLPAAVRNFAGRAAELAMLDALANEVYEDGRTVVISAIDGTAGVGKTALAVYWAHSVADRFPDGQLYVNLRGFDPEGAAVAPAEAVRGFLDALAVPADQVPDGLGAQAALFRSLLAGRRMLIVLDNARDAAQVRQLLPGAPGCLVLVTSRTRLIGLVATEGAQPLTLDLFTSSEAHDLLTRRIGPDRLTAEPVAVDQIVTACARLPLALSIVAARAGAHPRFPLSALAGELRQARGGLAALGGGDPSLDVRSVFSWSYRQLDPATGRLFRLLALHPGPDVGTAAVTSLAGERAAGHSLAGLARVHLVAEHAPGRFAFHDLLRAYAAELAATVDSESSRRAAHRRVLDHYLHTAYAADRLLDPHRQPITLTEPAAGVVPERLADRRQAMAWFTAERAVLLAAIGQAAALGFDAHARQIAWTLTTFLDRRGHWPDWAAAQRTALAAADRLGDQAAQARAHRDLARAYAQLGRYDDAHAHLRRALALFDGCADPAGQAHIHLGIGWLFDRQGRHLDALLHAERALRLFQAAGHRPGQANALNNVGAHQARLGNHGQALATCRRALRLHREIGDLRGQADTWRSLGFAHHRLGDHAQAIDCYREALDLFRDVGDRYQEAGVLTHLGDLRAAAGDRSAAHRAWQEAVGILDELGHADAQEIRQRLRSAAPAGETPRRQNRRPVSIRTP
jgi:tetratricopeptide (TPR) repeat protein